jgi:predicted RNase H-like HicB family nuclease
MTSSKSNRLKKVKTKLALKKPALRIKRMKKTTFASVVWKEGKYYVAQCLNIDISSFGKSKNEALENLQEALELYLEDEPTAKIAKIEKPSLEIQNV